MLPVMLAAILAARFARRAATHRTALGTPAARTGRARPAQPATESELAALAWNVGAGSSLSGLTLIAELEGLDAALAVRTSLPGRVVVRFDEGSTSADAPTVA